MSETGVYRIRCIVNNEFYVGSTSMTFEARWRVHERQLNSECHHSILLQRAWKKYGADAFIFEVLLYCDPEDCLTFEQIALDCYQPRYNISLDAHAPMKGRQHSMATRRRISASLRGNQYAAGSKRSTAFKKRMSLTTRGNNCGTSNGNAKLSEYEVQEIKKLLQSNITQVDIAKQFKVSRSMISAINKGKRRRIK